MPLPEKAIPIEPTPIASGPTRSAEPALPDAPGVPTVPGALEVRWSSLLHARFDRFGSGESAESGDRGPGHRRVDLVIAVQFLGFDRAMLESWLELPRGRKTVFARHTLTCDMSVDGELRHIDCRHDGRRLLALTLSGEETALYAQSDLLATAGFAGGMYDPPTARAVMSEREAVSA